MLRQIDNLWDILGVYAFQLSLLDHVPERSTIMIVVHQPSSSIYIGTQEKCKTGAWSKYTDIREQHGQIF